MSPKIKWHTPHKSEGTDREPDPDWPEDWPLPRVGDEITLPNYRTLLVKHVVMCPHGSSNHNSEPFVYVVLTKRTQINL